MAGNTRGRIKEHFEGIHKNIDWIQYHSDEIVGLIAGRNPKLSAAVNAFHAQQIVLDELAQSLYATI